jgi:hypothetical protein
MPKLGVLFDIDKLGGGLYGYAAYKQLFQSLPMHQFVSCSFSDGDTEATLQGRANHYCIAIESLDATKIAAIKTTLSLADGEGLLPLSSRFMDENDANRQPLVPAGYVTASAEITGDRAGWVTSAWQDIYGQPTRANTETISVSENDAADNAELFESSPSAEPQENLDSNVQDYKPLSESRMSTQVKSNAWRMWLILAGVILAVFGGVYLLTRDPNSAASVSAILPFLSTPTPMPGIGVNVRGTEWQVIVKQVRQDKTVRVGSGFSAKSWTAKEDYAFLIVDASFEHLQAKTDAPSTKEQNLALTPTPSISFDKNSIKSDQIALVAEDGAIVKPAGAIFAKSEMGDICGDCSMTFMTGSDVLDLNLVFLLKQNAITGKQFKLQFLDVPLIPFRVE